MRCAHLGRLGMATHAVKPPTVDPRPKSPMVALPTKGMSPSPRSMSSSHAAIPDKRYDGSDGGASQT